MRVDASCSGDSKAIEELNSLKSSHSEQSLTIQQLQQEVEIPSSSTAHLLLQLHKSDALLHEADLKNKAVQAEGTRGRRRRRRRRRRLKELWQSRCCKAE